MIRITTREIAELSQQEQDQMSRWTRDVLERATGRKRRKAIRLECDMIEQTEEKPQ